MSSFNPETTYATVLAWPKFHADIRLMAWLARLLPLDNIAGMCVKGVVPARNQIVEAWAKLPPAIDTLIMVDGDMHPASPKSKLRPWLDADADVVVCEYRTHNERAWADPAAIHCGLFRIKRPVLEAVARPLFMDTYNAAGTERKMCQGLWFAQQLATTDCSIVRAGWCHHTKFDD